MSTVSLHDAGRLLGSATGTLRDAAGAAEYHQNLLEGLRALVGCDGAMFRPGSRWPGSQAYYLDSDSRFTDGYVQAADTYRPEVATWCELTKGDRAIIDTELYSAAERRKKALYADVIAPSGVRSIMGCPLTVGGRVVGLMFLYRTGRAQPFRADQAAAIDPILRGLALAEVALARQAAVAEAHAALAALAPRQRAVAEHLLTGKREKEIAVALGLSPRTVHKYVEQVFRIAGVNSRAELMARFME